MNNRCERENPFGSHENKILEERKTVLEKTVSLIYRQHAYLAINNKKPAKSFKGKFELFSYLGPEEIFDISLEIIEEVNRVGLDKSLDEENLAQLAKRHESHYKLTFYSNMWEGISGILNQASDQMKPKKNQLSFVKAARVTKNISQVKRAQEELIRPKQEPFWFIEKEISPLVTKIRKRKMNPDEFYNVDGVCCYMTNKQISDLLFELLTFIPNVNYGLAISTVENYSNRVIDDLTTKMEEIIRDRTYPEFSEHLLPDIWSNGLLQLVTAFRQKRMRELKLRNFQKSPLEVLLERIVSHDKDADSDQQVLH